MQLLVCPGLPRCGTTYLFQNLAASGRRICNIPSTKEINYFSRFSDMDLSSFLSFYPDHRMDRYFVDFSPAYLSDPHAIARIVKASERNEVRIILSLRHPVDQAYAHYLHDLQAHISKLEQGQNVYYPFFSARSLRRYLVKRSDSIQSLVKAVGRENVFVVNFHRDFGDLQSLQKRLSAFLRTGDLSLSPERVSPGGWVPYYVFGGSDGMDVTVGDEIRTVPPDVLLLVNGPFSRTWENIESGVAQDLLRWSTSWARELTKIQSEILYDVAFRHDFIETLSVLGMAPDDFGTTRAITATVPTLSRSISESLPLRTGLREKVRECGSVSRFGR